MKLQHLAGAVHSSIWIILFVIKCSVLNVFHIGPMNQLSLLLLKSSMAGTWGCLVNRNEIAHWNGPDQV
jgi:hypothetical protein